MSNLALDVQILCQNARKPCTTSQGCAPFAETPDRSCWAAVESG
jgi:hypothetical protein